VVLLIAGATTLLSPWYERSTVIPKHELMFPAKKENGRRPKNAMINGGSAVPVSYLPVPPGRVERGTGDSREPEDLVHERKLLSKNGVKPQIALATDRKEEKKKRRCVEPWRSLGVRDGSGCAERAGARQPQARVDQAVSTPCHCLSLLSVPLPYLGMAQASIQKTIYSVPLVSLGV
jgi:hypothetical protein